jgi:2-phosphosulfolactate phosphatase
MMVKVGFTPVEEVAAPLGIVIDVLRATSTICQALASGTEQIVCVGEIADARALSGPGVALAGERANVRIEGFDFGNSPREFSTEGSDPLTVVTRSTLVLTTTNGTRLLLAAAARCEEVIVASLLNFDAVVREARRADEVAILCAGVEGAFALDDAYVAGRLAAALGGEHDDAAVAATRLAAAFASAEEGIGAGVSAANIRRAGLDDDIPFCARESVLELVPRVVARDDTSVVIAARPAG